MVKLSKQQKENHPPKTDFQTNKSRSMSRIFGNDISNNFESQISKNQQLNQKSSKENIQVLITVSPRRRKLKLRQSQSLKPWDQANLKDPQQVALYAGSITDYFFQIEENYQPNPNYFSFQTDVNSKMRVIVIEWLLGIHEKYRMVDEVMFLCVSLIDRYLSHTIINREAFQLVGLACLFIASKFEEIYPPSLPKLLRMIDVDKLVTAQEVLELEGSILNLINFQLTGPSINKFFERFAQITNQSQKNIYAGKLLLYLVLLESKMLKFKNSLIAASIIVVVDKMTGKTLIEKDYKEKFGYDKNEMNPCIKMICYLIILFVKQNNFTIIRKKFMKDSYLSVLNMF